MAHGLVMCFTIQINFLFSMFFTEQTCTAVFQVAFLAEFPFPCVKSMAAGFNRKIHNVSQGGLPYKFVRRIFVTLKIFHEKYRIIARGENCDFSV